jgi:hypothetical protein
MAEYAFTEAVAQAGNGDGIRRRGLSRDIHGYQSMKNLLTLLAVLLLKGAVLHPLL